MDNPDSKLSWAMGKKTVLCVGNAVIDCISLVRKFPSARAERSLKGYWQRGGHAANTATVLRNLGVNVEFFGVLSNSPMFSILLNDMRLRGICTENCPRSNLDPPFSSVILTKDTKTCTIVNCNPKFPYVSFEDFKKLDLNKYGWIHFRCREQEQTIEMMKVIEAYNAEHEDQKIVISLDVDSSLKSSWPLIDYCEYAFFSKQLAMELGWTTPKAACLNADELLRLRFGINLKRPLIVFKWGSQGAIFLDQDSNHSTAKAYKPKRIVDRLGAGEVFVGAFIYAIYVRERSNDIAADFANRIASHKCTKRGFDHIADILVAPDLQK